MPCAKEERGTPHGLGEDCRWSLVTGLGEGDTAVPCRRVDERRHFVLMRDDDGWPSATMDSALPGLPFVPALGRRRWVVMFVDVVESVRIVQRHEARFIDCWLAFMQQLRDKVLPPCGGNAVKSHGDGCLLTFETPAGAVRAALDMLDLARSFDAHLPSDGYIRLRVGIHLTEVVVGPDDLFGSGVNLAARLTGLGGPDDILVTEPIRVELVDGLALRLVDTGEHWLKHFDEPVRAWKVTQPGIEATSGLPPAMEIRPAIAAIPFARQPPNPAPDGLGQAISASIAGALMPCTLWRVISGLSTMYCAPPDRPAALAGVLNAAYLVTGEFREHDGRIDLRAQLVDGRSGELLWASPSMRLPVQALFDGGGDAVGLIAHSIGQALFNLALGRTSALPFSRLDDYCLHLASLNLMHRLRVFDHERAGELLAALETRHARSPEPHALRCRWHALRMVQGGMDSPADAGRDALRAARRALERDPDHRFALPMAALLAGQMGESLEEAEADARRALANDPHEPMAGIAYALLRGYRGDVHDFEAHCDAAVGLSPLDPASFVYRSIQASAKISADRPVDAAEVASAAIRANATYATAHLMMTIALAMQDKLEEARQSAQRVLKLEPGFAVGRYLTEFGGRQPPNAEGRARALLAAGLPP